MAHLELNIDKYIIERERKEKGEKGEGEEKEERGEVETGEGEEGEGVGRNNKYARSILKPCDIMCKELVYQARSSLTFLEGKRKSSLIDTEQAPLQRNLQCSAVRTIKGSLPSPLPLSV